MKISPAIKNPLGVNAIFAGMAEVAGTAVLPFVADAIARYNLHRAIAHPLDL